MELKDKNPPILAMTKDGKLAGTIIPTNLSMLVDCIKKGYKYKATVVKIEGGSCTVDIQPKEE